MGEAEQIRAFWALPLDPAAVDRIGRLVADLRGRIPGVKWASQGGLHLTLRFLGASRPRELARMTEALRPEAEACAAWEGPIGGLGMFPERGAPRVLWLAVELSEPLLGLQRACEKAARAAGFPPESRPFKSHLTLGRFRDRCPRPELPGVDLGTLTLDALVLYRSDLRPEGARYTALATLPLRRT